MTYKIRPAKIEDAQAIATVQIAAWRERLNAWAPQWFIDQFKQDQQQAKYAERITDPSYVVFVAEEDEKVIGFASSKMNSSEPKEFPLQIGALYVDPRHERKGVGKALLKQILTRAEQKPIMVWTFRDNVFSRRVYEACGGKLLPYTEAADMDLDIPHVSYGWNL